MSKYYSLKLLKYCFFFLLLLTEIKNDTKPKRKLPDDLSQLNIYLDLFNFNETIKAFDNLKNKKEVFIISMIKAKSLLEKIFLIDSDKGENAGLEIKVEEYKEYMEILYWNDTMFPNNTYISCEIYNLFVFFKFLPLNSADMFSKITFTYANDMPLMGLITINNNIESSKLKSEYLTLLFLQQFIKLLGFHVPYDNLK